MALQKTLVTKEDQHINEEFFRDAWGTELILFAHDATDIAKGHNLKVSTTMTGIQVSIATVNTVSRPD
jgi:hypothetical protein